MDKLIEIDRLLAMVEAKGDSAIALVKARMMLKEYVEALNGTNTETNN